MEKKFSKGTDYVNGEDGEELHDIIDLTEETIKKATK